MKYYIREFVKEHRNKIMDCICFLVKYHLLFIFPNNIQKDLVEISKKQNIFVYVKKDGTKLYNPKIKNIKITYSSFGNYIEVHQPKKIKEQLFIQVDKRSKVIIGKDCNIGKFHVILSRDSSLVVGDRLMTVDAELTQVGGCNKNIIIGQDCQFSHDITIRASDAHCIYDNKTKNLLNRDGKDLIIGNHVWIGQNVVILKNGCIPDDSIVGAGSIVTKPFELTNCIIAGNPAKVIKQNINWNEEYIYNWDIIKNNLS